MSYTLYIYLLTLRLRQCDRKHNIHFHIIIRAAELNVCYKDKTESWLGLELARGGR